MPDEPSKANETKRIPNQTATEIEESYYKTLTDSGYPFYFWAAQAIEVSDSKQPNTIAVGYKDPVKGLAVVIMPKAAYLQHCVDILKKYGSQK